MFIPEDKINQIKERTNIVDIIGEYVRLKKSGNNYRGLCPFHTEKTPSFTVNPDKGIFHCFGCGSGGNAFNFIMKFKGVTFPEAVKLVGERVGIQVNLSYNGEDVEHGKYRKLLNVIKEVVDFYIRCLYSSEGKKALEYLRSRLISPETIKHFNLGFAPESWDSALNSLRRKGFNDLLIEEAGIVVKRKSGSGYYDRFRNRIIFPIQDTSGRFIGLGGRVLPGSDAELPKYINTNENMVFHKGKHLYGLYQAENPIRNMDSIFIAEGYVDVLRMHEAGYRNTVAPLGTALTEEQVSLFMRYTRNVYLVFDPDEAGRKATLKSISLMHRKGIDPFVIRLPANCDPGDFFNSHSNEDFDLLIKEAIPGIDFIISYYLGHKNLYTANEKLVILKTLSEYYTNMGNEIFQADFLLKVSNALDVNKNIVEREMRPPSKPWAESPPVISSLQRKKSIIDIELYLLLLVMANPDLFPFIESRLDESYFHGKYTKKLWNAILQVSKTPSWNAASVLDRLEDQRFIEYLSGRLMEEIFIKNPKEQVIDVLAKLKETRVKERLHLVNLQLKKAELENDTVLETELIMEMSTWRSELEKVRLLRATKANFL
ncbi:MAG: DNA primase [Spirochaetota bacterium]